MVDRWDTLAYLDFNPPIRGTYKWRAANELMFSPVEPFAPSTDYEVKLGNPLGDLNGGQAIDKSQTITFHTPYLQLQTVRAYWKAESDNAEAMVHYDFGFNYEVKPSDLVNLVSLQVDGQAHNIELVTQDESSSVTVRVPGIKAEDRVFSSEVNLKEGLKPARGRTGMVKAVVENLDIQSPYRFSILDIQTTHDGSEGKVTVSTSQQVSRDNIKNFIRLQPAVNYTVDITAQSFTLSSENFDVNQKYALTLRENLAGALGGSLKTDYNQDLSFGELRPTVKFNNRKSIYLAGKGNKNLEVTIVNVDKVKVRITKVYENNIFNFLGSSDYRYDYEADEYFYDYDYYRASNLGDVVWEQEIETSQLGRSGPNRVIKMDFEDKIPNYRGLYILQVSSDEEYYLRANKVVNISDIGLIAKAGKKGVAVFANSLETAQPISGASVNFIGNNNQLVSTVQTDAEGYAYLEMEDLLAPGFTIGMITANLEEDFNYLPFNNTSVNTSRFEVGGKYQNSSGYEAFLYAERDIYRPGESINISGIIRDFDWQMMGEVPVKLKVITPSGKEYTTIRKTLNEFGSFEATVETPSAALTGSYSFQLYTSNDVLLSSKSIQVEEFVPDRIKVEIKADKEELKSGETLWLDLKATNFFGPPAANRNYEVDFSLQRQSFYSREHSDYNFGLQGYSTSFDRDLRSGSTDATGSAQEDFIVSGSYRDMGLLRADIFVTVFDETGRPVSRRQTARVYTQDVFYGVQRSGYYFKTGSPVKVPLVALDKEFKELEGVSARVQLIKHEYKTVLAKSGRYFRYNSQKVERVIESKEVSISGTANNYTFTPELSGRYEVRVSRPGARTYVSRRFYVYGWGRTSYSSFEVDTEGQIDIALDKERYETGDIANVILKTPFAGRVLVTVETDEVVDHFYVDTDKRAASFQLELDERHIPNVYISATLFKPHTISELPLTVAHGVAPVVVDNPANNMAIEIEAPETSRSHKKQTIKVKGAPNSAVTLAVVDEGILQLTGYSTPNPYNFFYGKRALQVTSYDLYPYLFPEIATSSTGGDAMAMEKRVNPLTNTRIKLVSYWSGVLTTDGSGEASYEIDIPQFSGDLRIMAVGYKDQTFGSARTNMKVADPLVISTALPRFLSPRDVLKVPVVVSNTTESAASCDIKINVEGPMTVNGSSEQKVSIGANSEGIATFDVLVSPAIGQGKISVTVDGLGEEFLNETDITVRPAAPLQKINGSGIVKSGDAEAINMDVASFIPASVDNQLIVSKSPLVEFTDDLEYLIRYPYGCIEQTVSSAFPQLYFSDIANDIIRPENSDANPAYNVRAAISKLQLMQLYNGGMVYWPNGGYESWWGSVYAAHFLLEAEKAGFAVDKTMLNKLLNYLKGRLKEKKLITYFFNRNQNKRIVPKEIPYSLFVLSLAGKPQKSTMNYYKSNLHELSLDGKYLLATAYYLSGDTKRYQEVLPPAFEGEESNAVFGGSFYSHLRDEALALYCLLEVDPDNQQVGIMARHVSSALKNRRYLNTQERSFSFLSLGKIARKAAASDIQATISVNGSKVADFDNETITLKTNDLNGTAVNINASGSGQLYYFWDAEGISADGSYNEEDSYLQVRKTFYDRYGGLITNNSFEQNDLVVVKLSVRGLTASLVENVVITDMLPAGFEIENPRVSEIPGMNWIKDKSSPTHLDIRDDRINLFVDVGASQRSYYYVVRAVSKGDFQMGPVGADAMYNGEYHSYHGGGVIKVLEKGGESN